MTFDLLKTIPHYLIPQHSMTHLAGFLADCKNTRVKNYLIDYFIKKYQVNMSEAVVEDPKAYLSFNDFFIRLLKPECRPIANADIVSPVDGVVSEFGPIEEGQLVQAKGRYYGVEELLAGDQELARTFINGQFATLYLSPKDYHRVHMPIDASLIGMNYIPGTLFSVQPITTRVVPKLFTRNERLAVIFDTSIGPMAMVMVGATLVGSIATKWHGDLKRTKKRMSFDYPQNKDSSLLRQGEVMGFFKLGSTVILLFANGKQVQWAQGLKVGKSIRFGEEIAGICNPI